MLAFFDELKDFTSVFFSQRDAFSRLVSSYDRKGWKRDYVDKAYISEVDKPWFPIIVVGQNKIWNESMVPELSTGGSCRFITCLAKRDNITTNRGAISNSTNTVIDIMECNVIFEAFFGNLINRYFMPSLMQQNYNGPRIVYDELSSIVAFHCQEIVKNISILFFFEFKMYGFLFL